MNISALGGILKNLFIPHAGNDFKPRFLQSDILLYAVIGILALKIITVAVYLPVSYNFFFADITKSELVNLLNQNRQSLGLGTLEENQKLNEAARLKAQDMVKNGYFAHQSPAGTTPWFWFKQAGYEYKYAGENLAVGFVDSKVVYDAWVNSPSHKANLLNANYTQVGTAVVTGFEGNSTLVVQLFGKPQTAVAANSNTQLPISKQISNPKTENPKPQPQPQPEPVLVQESRDSNITPEVLGSQTEQIVGPEYAGKRNIYLRVLNFIVYDNNAILQYLSLSVLAIILLCLGINAMLMFRVQNRVMLLRPAMLAVMLGAAFFLDKSMVSQLLPYHVFI